MKRLKKTLKIFGISITSIVGILVCLLFIPYPEEGTYYAGREVQCLCDCKHYIRINDGVVSVYSMGSHDEAFITGSYELEGEPQASSSHNDISAPLKTSLHITDSSIVGIRISGSENKFLFRTSPFCEIHSAIDRMEVECIHSDSNSIHRDYLDKNHQLIRTEKHTLPNKTLHPTTDTL